MGNIFECYLVVVKRVDFESPKATEFRLRLALLWWVLLCDWFEGGLGFNLCCSDLTCVHFGFDCLCLCGAGLALVVLLGT